MGNGLPRDARPFPALASWDEALERLERYLASYPEERALPGLDSLVRQAGVTEDFLRNDERALKVLREALVDRPLGDADAVAQVRTRVELLTLEVEALAECLETAPADSLRARRLSERLEAVRRGLAEVRHLL